jgi:hypothetical protein
VQFAARWTLTESWHAYLDINQTMMAKMPKINVHFMLNLTRAGAWSR